MTAHQPLTAGRAVSRRPLRWAMALCLAAALLLTNQAVAEDGGSYGASAPDTGALPNWSETALDAWEALPVQDHGRIKPMSTLARYTLLPINGRTKVTIGEEKRPAMAWMLDALFFPEKAATYPFFQIQDSSVLEAAGDRDLYKQKRKRDRYTYTELLPLAAEIHKQADAWAPKGRKNLTTVQAQMVDLSTNLKLYDQVIHTLDWARVRFDLTAYPVMSSLLEGKKEVRVSDLLRNMMAIYMEGARRARANQDAPDNKEAKAEFDALAKEMQSLYREQLWEVLDKPALALFPPAASTVKEPRWFSSQAFLRFVNVVEAPPSRMIAMLATFEALVDATGDMATFDRTSEELLEQSRTLANERGEYDRIELEVAFYNLSPFHWSLGWFLIGFLVIALSWLKPGLKFVGPVAWLFVGAGLAFCIFGITLRCIIRERPPVSTLYETILFITACSVLTCLVVEWINRKRLALGLAAVLGAAGMFLSWMYDEFDAKDTMPQLQAVLDTNFWLATHVTTITFGYAAGLLASGLAHIYVLGKAFGLKLTDANFYRVISRMIYGALAFCLLLSLVGTILGGIWANDSWGRFWGWDPKENGALMICLWTLAILHARMGGYVKAFGIAQAAIFGGIIVGWSWWGVNLLGAGLHSYGFTHGVAKVLYTCMLVECAVMATGFVWWLVYGRTGRAAAAARAATAGASADGAAMADAPREVVVEFEDISDRDA